MKKEGKRRSDRIILTIPLQVHGTDDKGQRFEVEGRTSVLSRRGAQISVNRRLQRDQTIRLISLMSRLAADFRVVGAVTPFSAEGGEYGVEYLDHTENIWGIEFPPLRAGETAESNALLECRSCRTVELLSLSPTEVEVLQTSGILTKPCAHCQTTGPWSYSDRPLAMGEPPNAPEEGQEEAATGGARGRERRRHQRAQLRLPVRIRDYSGGVEITQSENISKGGLCFASEKKHEIGEGLLVTCPYQSTGENIEIRAHVASAREVEGSSRIAYGVRYPRQGR